MYDYAKKYVTVNGVPSALDCMVKCQATTTCQSWSFGTNNTQRCLLFEGPPKVVGTGEFTSGPKFC